MSSISSRFNFAIIISFIVGLVLFTLIRANFSYITPFYVWILGLPSFVIFFLLFWLISAIPSLETKITASILVIFLALLILPSLFLRNKHSSYYFITPNSEIVLSTFPGDEFSGKSLGEVNDVILKAYDWQQGNKTDASGKTRRFYRIKPDGSVLIHDHPVENQEVLRELDNETLEVFEKQQIQRAKSFLEEKDLKKAREILSQIQELDPYADSVYRLLRDIEREEKASREEQEKAEAARLEAERILEAERAEKEMAENSASIVPPEETEHDPVTNPSRPAQEVTKPRIATRSPAKKYQPRAKNYRYSQPSSYYEESYNYNRQAISNNYQPPQVTYSPSPVEVKRLAPPRVQQNRTYNYPSRTNSNTGGEIQRNSEIKNPKRKKKSFWKKPAFLIGIGVGAAIGIEIIRKQRKNH